MPECSVYVIGTMRGPKKIGYAAVPRRRLSGLRRFHEPNLTVLEEWPLESVPTAAAVEAVAHIILHDRRISGEWFNGSLQYLGAAVDTACAVVEDCPPDIDLREMRRVASGERSRDGRELARAEGRLYVAKHSDEAILEFVKLGFRKGAKAAGLSMPGFQKAVARARKRLAEKLAKRGIEKAKRKAKR